MAWSASLSSLTVTCLLAASPALAAPVQGRLQLGGTGGIQSGTAATPDIGYVKPRVEVNRRITQGGAAHPPTVNGQRPKSNPAVKLSYEGTNLYTMSGAVGFGLEPPDQGLCAGNGFVIESVNVTIAVYDQAGHLLAGPADLGPFHGRPPQASAEGYFMSDPSCYFDADTQRWFAVILSIDPTFSHTFLEIAVSQTADPRGAWNQYHLPTDNDGVNGPDHGCAGPCLPDYPHIGADANGFYITANEFGLNSNVYNGAQIYAIQKRALAAGSQPNYVLFNTNDPAYQFEGNPGFTILPATSPAGIYATGAHGTEFLVSTLAVYAPLNVESRLLQWNLTNTASLDTTPALSLTRTVVNVSPYAVPAVLASQKAGPVPLGDYWGFAEQGLDPSDSRLLGLMYANGKLWAALSSGITQGATPLTAGAYYVFSPQGGRVYQQGYLSLPGNNVIYPSVGVTPAGRGVIGVTVTGPDYYPSAGYASLDAVTGAGPVQIAAAGAGPQDGFTEYDGRPRWGDYPAASVDGKNIWFANEYIAQTCTDAQYATDNTCGGTRRWFGNWSTRVTMVTP